VTVTHKAWWDISIGGAYKGRIEFGLFGRVAPLTVSNFRHLTNHTFGKGYKGTRFHRIIAQFMLQGGDYHYGDGFGFDSIYGGEFADETFELVAYGAGWLGMANRGPDSNGCQIYISTVVTDWLDNKHVVMGIVLSGMDVVRLMEYTPTWQNCLAADMPEQPVVVTDCGLLEVDTPFDVIKEAVGDDGVPEDKRFYHVKPEVQSYVGKVERDCKESLDFHDTQLDAMSRKLTQIEATQTESVNTITSLLEV
jgi:peptidyl-prolyl cis-trans isomerase B (cyclophilin B)